MTGDGLRGLAVKLAQECEVLARGRVRGEVLHCRVGGGDPAIAVEAIALRVVDVHLDEVLVEAVIAAGPAAVAVEERAVLGADVGADQAGPGLGAALGREQVRLAPVGELRILGVARQVAQARPLEDQGADLGQVAAGGAADAARGVQDQVAVGNAARRVKGEADRVGQAGGLGE